MLNADVNALIGTHDVLLITLDTLRYDVAQRAFQEGRTPALATWLPERGWERRHTPGSFTYAAHCAFFAGFLPTPPADPKAPRLFAAAFAGSETSRATTCVLDAPDIPTGLAARGYHTVCVGGVGFFNPATPLGRVLPGLFAEAHWSEELGVTSAHSTRAQVDVALSAAAERDERVFLFLNVSALHQPNCIFAPGCAEDTPETMAAALAYADPHLGRLIETMRRRGPLLVIVTSDHGTCYGDDGHWGHRLAHPVVWEVPYAEFIAPAS